MKAVADTSSLIHPAKVPTFWEEIHRTFDEIMIPEAVHKEILKGKEIGSSDVPVIERAVDQGWIKVMKVTVPQNSGLPDNLGLGEKEAIVLMRKKRKEADWLLMDDEIASRTARLFNFEVRPAVYLLIYWTRKNRIGASNALALLDDLVDTGYRLSSKDYVSVKKSIR